MPLDFSMCPQWIHWGACRVNFLLELFPMLRAEKGPLIRVEVPVA